MTYVKINVRYNLFHPFCSMSITSKSDVIMPNEYIDPARDITIALREIGDSKNGGKGYPSPLDLDEKYGGDTNKYLKHYTEGQPDNEGAKTRREIAAMLKKADVAMPSFSQNA